MLEYIPFIWNRLKFLNKVTVRNLFRYKKRFFMTVFGIMGCTALVLTGFAIKDSVTNLLPEQYDEIYRYDMMTVVNEKDYAAFVQKLSSDKNISEFINLRIDNSKIINKNGDIETIQVMVLPEGTDISDYVKLVDTDDKKVQLDDSGIFLTQNASEMLAVNAGDMVTLRDTALKQGDVKISAIVRNYFGNNVYITQNAYEQIFGELKPDGILANLSKECTDKPAYAESLMDNDMVLSSTSTEGLKDEFSSNFALINAVVYMFIALAAGLAFVVLFTLSNTNISERTRELATTKVLGFYDNEVHSYVNKETLILTLIGIAVGLPVGRFLSRLLTSALKMPSMYFATYIEPVSYLYAAAISLSFALIVSLITNRILNHVDMVEALKSVE